MQPNRWYFFASLVIISGVTALAQDFGELLRADADRQRQPVKNPIRLVSDCDEMVEYHFSDRSDAGGTPSIAPFAEGYDSRLQPEPLPSPSSPETDTPSSDVTGLGDAADSAEATDITDDTDLGDATTAPLTLDDAALDAFDDSTSAPDSAGRRAPPQQSTPSASQLVNINTIGDFFDESLRTVTVLDTQSYAFHTEGFIVSGSEGSASSLLVFEANGGIPDDFTTIGTGIDASGDGNADSFNMAEPLPPNEVPTSPGPEYTYDGGTVVYTRDMSTTQAVDGAYPASSPDNNWFASYSYSRASDVVVGGLALRRVKIAELNSPIPKHRIYGSFNFYNDVINNVGDVSRYFLGIERPFYQDLISLDLRVPFASTLDTTQTTAGVGARSAQFGNIVLTAKAILLRRESCVLTGGLGFGFPTGDASRVVSSTTNRELLRIDNDAVHILPFVAGLWSPNSCFFTQWFLQWDVDANGNDVFVNDGSQSMANVGRLQDQTLTFFDITFGGWLRRCPGKTLWGIVPVAELHYSTTSQDSDVVSRGSFQVGNVTNRFDALNLTLGTHFMVRQSTITVGSSIPLRQSNYGDRQFDYELMAQFERRF